MTTTSPNQVKDFPRDDKQGSEEMTILQLVDGDEKMEKEALRHCNNIEDDPPIFFGWNHATLTQFYNKAVAYGADGGEHLPPPPIFGGAHPTIVGTSSEALPELVLQKMQKDILSYISLLSSDPEVIGGDGASGAFGLGCSALQKARAVAHMAVMPLTQPWFQAVLATGAPLTGPLAHVYMPRPITNSCIRVSLPGILFD
jgi:hypothetical protein